MDGMRLLTREAIFLRGVDGAVSPLLSGDFETIENIAEDFLFRSSIGFLPSSAVKRAECRIGAASPSFSDLESFLKKAGSRLTLWVCPRLRGLLSVSGDDSKASAKRRSGIRTVAVLLGDTNEGSRGGYSQSSGVMKRSEEDPSRREDSGPRGTLSWT